MTAAESSQATDSANLLSLSPDTMAVPKSRLASAQHARDIFQQDVRNYAKRSERNAQLAGMIDGNPPLVASKLKEMGQGNRSNFSTGEGDAFLKVALTAFFDAVMSTETWCRITVNERKPEAGEYGNALTQNFQWLLNEFRNSMDSMFQTTQYDLVLYGMGPVFWDDEFNWMPKRIDYSLVRLPEGAASDIDEWPRVSIEYNFEIGELYRFIADPEIAKQAGWNIEAVKEAIVTTATGSDAAFAGENRWEIWQRRLNENEIYWSERIRRVRVARILFKEFADKDGNEQISDAWVATNTASDKFLFKKERRFNAFHEAGCPFFYERGYGKANGIKGLGVRMFGLLAQEQRMLNAAVDACYSSMTTFLQPVGAGSNTNLPIINRGPYTIFPAGIQFIQRNVQGVMDAPMAMRDVIRDTRMSNLANYRQRIEEKGGNPRTAFELQTLVTQNSVLSATQLARYFEQLDMLAGEMFRRATQAPITGIQQKWAVKAREFRQRCKDDGVPESCFKNCTVKWVRPVGAGNPQQRFQALLTIKQLLGPTMSAQGMESLDRDIVNALGTPDAVRRYLPEPMNRIEDQQNAWEAQSENNDFTLGGQMPVIDGQDDVVHLEIHLGFLDAAAQSVQQGADPFKILTAMEAGGAHCAKHLVRLEKNKVKEGKFKEFEQRFRQLAQATDNLRGHLEAQMKAQQEQQASEREAEMVEQGMDPETRIKAAKAQNDMALKNAKAQQQMALKARSAEQNMALKDASTAQNLAISRASTGQDIAITDAKAEQDMAIKRAQTMTPTPSMTA